MIRADYRPLEQGPCILNAISVNVSSNVLLSLVIDRFVLCVLILNAEVCRMLVSIEVLGIWGGSLSNPLANHFLARILAPLFRFHSDRSAAFDCAKNHSLVAEILTPFPMPLAADPSLVQL